MPAMVQNSSATYSFSSAPKPVSAARKKYREPGEVDVTLFRDLKETCISWDKRVHRGNTYSMYTQNAIKEALQAANQETSPKPARRRKVKESSPFDMPLPEAERIPVDLTRHLVAKEVPIEVVVVEAQTDEFLPEPPPEQYQPQKSGIDAHTQVEDGELFNFDNEVEPILDVLVMKTIEQSIMEVEEEHELTRMSTFKGEWYERQAQMMTAWQKQVDEEWVRWHEKEAIVQAKMAEKRREAQVLLKIQAITAAKTHLRMLVPNAIKDLQPVAFPDQRSMEIDQLFLPQLFSRVQQQVQTIKQVQHKVDEVIACCIANQHAARKTSLEDHQALHARQEAKRFEELQIRQGKIRILVDTGAGTPVPVGPVQISSKDSIDQIQDRVYAWLQENESHIASAWPHGVLMLIDGQPVKTSSQLFEAKPGQISMAPKEPPPVVVDEDQVVDPEPDDAG
jgi:radial spoke head protein 3